MSSLRVSRIYFELTVFIANLIRILRVFREYISYSLWNYYYFREFTINSLFLSQIYQEFAILLWIHFQFRELNINPNSFWRIHYDFAIESRIYYEFNIFSADLRWIKYYFREFNLNSLSIREYTLNLLRIYYLFGGFTTNSPSFSRINYKFTFYFPNKQWIYFLFLENAMYFLPVSRIYSEYTWYFANSLWLYHLYRKCTICPWIHYEFTMNLSPLSATITFYLLRIHYLYYKE